MGETLKGIGGCAIQIVWFGIGCAQLFAIMDFAALHWGLGSFISFIVGLLLAYIPIVGTGCGICGAVYAWGWSWWAACLLYLWPYPLFALVMLFAAVSEKRS